MKGVTKFFMAALLAGMCGFGYANNRLSNSDSLPENLYVLRVYYNSLVCESGDPEPFEKAFNRAMNNAFKNIPEGARFAIDHIITNSNCWDIEKMEINDYVVDYLLDNGYSVVAKQHLEKLFEEQQTQQSGIFNEKTTAKENNFSGVGYYISVKITKDCTIRVHIINVSTGEYEGSGSNY